MSGLSRLWEHRRDEQEDAETGCKASFEAPRMRLKVRQVLGQAMRARPADGRSADGETPGVRWRAGPRPPQHPGQAQAPPLCGRTSRTRVMDQPCSSHGWDRYPARLEGVAKTTHPWKRFRVQRPDLCKAGSTISACRK